MGYTTKKWTAYSSRNGLLNQAEMDCLIKQKWTAYSSRNGLLTQAEMDCLIKQKVFWFVHDYMYMIICLDKLPKHFGVQIYMLSMIKHKQCWLHIICCLAPDFVGAELALMEQLYI